MKSLEAFSRRNFLRTTSIGLGAGWSTSHSMIAGPTAQEKAGSSVAQSARLPREIWVASFCQHKCSAATFQEMVQKVRRRMDDVVSIRPDVVCLPEMFHTANLTGDSPSRKEASEQPLGEISRPFAEFAREHNCYVICPIATQEGPHFYNAAVIIDRQGKYVGEYRKINPTDGELESGITPGPIDPPVFKTDFGTIGIQICFDVNWHENWKKLSQKGAELVFWPSAFPGGQMLNGLAWINKYYIVGSTRIRDSKIVDPLGKDMVSTGRFDDWVCGPINLDVAVIQGWRDINKLKKIQNDLGRKVHLRILHEEALALLEGLSGDISVPNLLKEYDVYTSNQMLARCTEAQNAKRP